MTDPDEFLEPADVGDDAGVPVDLVELHEVLEYQAALDAQNEEDA